MADVALVTIIPIEGTSESFQVPREHVFECKTLASSLEWSDGAQVIPVSFRKKTIEQLFEYIFICRKHQECNTCSSETEAWITSIDLLDLADLCNAANFVNHEGLLAEVAKRIACIIVENDIGTLRAILGITEPMSEQDEQSVRLQNEMCFRSHAAK